MCIASTAELMLFSAYFSPSSACFSYDGKPVLFSQNRTGSPEGSSRRCPRFSKGLAWTMETPHEKTNTTTMRLKDIFASLHARKRCTRDGPRRSPSKAFLGYQDQRTLCVALPKTWNGTLEAKIGEAWWLSFRGLA